MKQIRVAIIGTGAISNRHMKVWPHIPGAKVVCAAEIDAAKLKAWGERYGFEEKDLYTDFREMLKRDDIDAVDVCVHNNLHAPVCIAVMKAGYPCYGEKPMSATYYDSKLMYDCAKKLGVKFAVQISSLFTEQTRMAKEIIGRGSLGQLYHARSAFSNYRRRVTIDTMPFASPSFMDREMAGHGPSIDQGIYRLGQMLFLLGLPELDSVYGTSAQMLPNPTSKKMEVEDTNIALAKFKSGITLEMVINAASNMEDVGPSFISGIQGALQLINVDSIGNDWSMGTPPWGQLAPNFQHGLKFFGEFGGNHIEADLKPYFNQTLKRTYDPDMSIWYDNQAHWYAYLTGQLTDETRYDTPLIGMQTSLLTDGIFMSSELGRSVTADEIKAWSKSDAMWRQETPWGVFDYEDTF